MVVAKSLLGCILHTVSPEGETSGQIVETEAYLGADDPASHAARLKSGGVLSMAGPPGIAYVYRSYGIHAMLNVVAEPEGRVGAVLIRALAPLSGLDLMRERRGVSGERVLCAGPGRLCQAMGIRLDHHGTDLTTSDDICLTAAPPPGTISAGERIGISRGREAPWRFFATHSRFVSAHLRGQVIAAAPAEGTG